MAGTAVRGRLSWLTGTVTQVAEETATVRTIRLELAGWPGHRAGQHLDVRLTAEDGYTAERSYSIASAPGEPVEITVQRLDDGEVSPYLTQELRAGDELEVRGPIGGYFVWDGDLQGHDGPLLLVAGGSGIVPLRSILRHRHRTGSQVTTQLLYSARSLPEVIYRAELDGYGRDGVQVIYTLTRSQPAGWTGRSGRLDAGLLADVAWPAGQHPVAFVCGPTPFVEAAAAGLVAIGYPADRVKTERFGATGR
jgi:ferredoxin-NADP reductase